MPENPDLELIDCTVLLTVQIDCTGNQDDFKLIVLVSALNFVI